MRLAERQQQLDTLLPVFHDLWHPQPFREIRPGWCDVWPSLADAVLKLPDAEVVQLNVDGLAGLALLTLSLIHISIAAFIGVGKHLKVVFESAHPRCHFFFFGTR